MRKYKMTLRKPIKNFLRLTLIGDVNDADYITSTTDFDIENFETALEALYICQNKLLGSYKLENYCNLCTINEGYILDEIDLPRCEDRLCHTLKEVMLEKYHTDGTIDIITLVEKEEEEKYIL